MGDAPVTIAEKTCACCGNVYDKAFEVAFNGKRYLFDCFECAVHLLAPACKRCGCRIIGHGVEVENEMFCGAHCARLVVAAPVADRA